MLESDFRLTTHHLICPGRFDEFRVRFEIMEPLRRFDSSIW